MCIIYKETNYTVPLLTTIKAKGKKSHIPGEATKNHWQVLLHLPVV